MKDELSIISEMISGATKLLYAKKRRQLRGLPPMTSEEEKEYTEGPSTIKKTAYLKILPNGLKWVARASKAESDADSSEWISSDSHASVLIYKLVKNHYTDIFMILHSGAAEQQLTKEDINSYYEQGEDVLNRRTRAITSR